MALKIRLARAGAKKQPYYRIVIADSKSPRDGKFIEKVGVYNPMLERTNEKRVVLQTERLKYWLSVGAQPTDRVAKFLGFAKLAPMPEQTNNPLKAQPKKKAQERMKAEAEALAKAEAAKTAAIAEAEAAKAAPVVEVAPVVVEEAAVAAEEAPAAE